MVLADARGASAVEYVISVVLVALFALGAWQMLGGAVDDEVTCAALAVGGTRGPCVAGDGSPDSTFAGAPSSVAAGPGGGSDDRAGSIPTATQIALLGGDGSSTEGLDRSRDSDAFVTPIALYDDGSSDGAGGDPVDTSDPGGDDSSGTAVFGSADDGGADSGAGAEESSGPAPAEATPEPPPPENCAWYDAICKGRQAAQRLRNLAESAVERVQGAVNHAVESLPDWAEAPLRLQGGIAMGILKGAYDVTAGAVKYTIAAAENYGRLGWSIVDPNNGLSLSERLRNGVRFAVATAALTQGPTGIVMAMMIVNTPTLSHSTDNPLLGLGYGLLDVAASPVVAGYGVVRGVGQEFVYAVDPYNGATLEERTRALTRGTLTTGLVVAGRFGQPKGYLPYTNTAVLGQSERETP